MISKKPSQLMLNCLVVHRNWSACDPGRNLEDRTVHQEQLPTSIHLACVCQHHQQISELYLTCHLKYTTGH